MACVRRLATSLLLLALAVAGCGGPPAPVPTDVPSGRPAERDQLASLAAAAKDKRYVATYTLAVAKRPDRTVTVAYGSDGSWVVAIPAGALGGLADVAIYSAAPDSASAGNSTSAGAGLFQCALGPATGTAGSRPDLGPITPGCVKVGSLGPTNDPKVEHVFTDWIDPLLDRATALSVASAPPLPGASGSCFSVESNSVALAPPVDPGVYCYRGDGILTAVQTSFGSLTLIGTVAAAPPSVTMPGPVVNRPPLPMTAPPAPPPSPSGSPRTG
jgi:hypothetical protein